MSEHMPDKGAPSMPPAKTSSLPPAGRPRGLSPNRVIGAFAVLAVAAFFLYVGFDSFAHPDRLIAESTSRRGPDTEEGAKLQGLFMLAVGLGGVGWGISLLRTPKPPEQSGGEKRPPQP